MNRIKLPEGIGELEFKQFIEVCKFFDVGIIDKAVSEVGQKEDGKLDYSKVKLRKDFENMEAEIIEAYLKLPRYNRRQIDVVITKIVKANRAAHKIIDREYEFEHCDVTSGDYSQCAPSKEMINNG